MPGRSLNTISQPVFSIVLESSNPPHTHSTNPPTHYRGLPLSLSLSSILPSHNQRSGEISTSPYNSADHLSLARHISDIKRQTASSVRANDTLAKQ